MAKERSYFFDSVDGDRKYSAGDFALAFETIFSNGVIASPATSLRVVADGSGRQVQVSYGGAIIKGRFYSLQDDGTGLLTIPIPAGIPNGATALIVARYSNATNIRRISIEAVTERMTAETEHDLVLAQVVVSNNIAQAAVTDTRYNPALCGVIGVAGLSPQSFAAAYEAFVATISGSAPVLQAHIAQDLDNLPTDTAEVVHSLGVVIAQALLTRINARLPSSSYTAADVLAKIKTVDGTGSGLDADTVDGKDASAFAAASHTQAINTIIGLLDALNAKQATVTGAASTITGSNLTANRVLVANGSGKVAVSSVAAGDLRAIKFGASQPSMSVGDIWLKDLGKV